MDGVDGGFYLGVHSQGKAYRHGIKDISPAMMKVFLSNPPTVNQPKTKPKLTFLRYFQQKMRLKHIFL